MFISHVPIFLIPFFFSCFSNSPVLHCFCNESSLHIHRAPAIRIDSSPSWGFLITRHIELNLAYINLATGSSYTKPSPRHPRAQHTSNPTTFQPRGYTLLPPSLNSQCVGIRLSIRLAKVGFPKYVTNTTKCLVQKIHNEWPLSHIVGNITQHSR